MKKIVIVAAATAFAAGGLLAVSYCADTEYRDESDKFIVGVVMKSSSSEYWMSVKSGMEAAASENDMEIVYLAPDSELKEDVQERMVDYLIDRNVDALAISPIDSFKVPEYKEEVEEQEFPAVTFDTAFYSWELPYVGIENYKVGYELAEVLAEELGHAGEVGIVSGDLNQMGHRERTEGFQAYMDTEEEIEVVFLESGYSNLQMSEQKVKTLLQEYPDVRGIFATSAVTALGLAQETADEEIKIVTVDEQEDSLDAVENGSLTALAAQSGYQIGYETINLIDELRNEEGKEMSRYLEAEILTSENIEAYREAENREEY